MGEEEGCGYSLDTISRREVLFSSSLGQRRKKKLSQQVFLRKKKKKRKKKKTVFFFIWVSRTPIPFISGCIHFTFFDLFFGFVFFGFVFFGFVFCGFVCFRFLFEKRMADLAIKAICLYGRKDKFGVPNPFKEEEEEKGVGDVVDQVALDVEKTANSLLGLSRATFEGELILLSLVLLVFLLLILLFRFVNSNLFV